jgi:hypothetical protein
VVDDEQSGHGLRLGRDPPQPGRPGRVGGGPAG